MCLSDLYLFTPGGTRFSLVAWKLPQSCARMLCHLLLLRAAQCASLFRMLTRSTDPGVAHNHWKWVAHSSGVREAQDQQAGRSRVRWGPAAGSPMVIFSPCSLVVEGGKGTLSGLFVRALLSWPKSSPHTITLGVRVRNQHMIFFWGGTQISRL